MILIKEKKEDFPYDVTMFWEFFRWERHKLGHIYLQCFPNGKLYAGQTVNIYKRMGDYRRCSGNNPHHTSALKKHEWEKVRVLTIKCPIYMLDSIEIFLISYYKLMNPNNGYNKTSGGHNNWYVSEETRKLRGKRSKEAWAQNPQRRLDQTIRQSGKKNHMFNKKWTKTADQIAKTSGNNNWQSKIPKNEHPLNGKKQTPRHIAKRTGQGKGNSGKFGQEHPAYGKKKTVEQIAKISGKNNINFGKVEALSHCAKPVCVFGTVYPAAICASNYLRIKYAPRREDNFIPNWIRANKNQSFYIDKWP